jgi:hypothetical protein
MNNFIKYKINQLKRLLDSYNISEDKLDDIYELLDDISILNNAKNQSIILNINSLQKDLAINPDCPICNGEHYYGGSFGSGVTFEKCECSMLKHLKEISNNQKLDKNL